MRSRCSSTAAPADRISALAFSQIDRLGTRAKQLVSTNLDLTRAFLARYPQLEIAAPPEATIVFPRIRGVKDCGPFVQRVFEEHGVALASGSFFGAPDHFRISLAGKTDLLEKGLDLIGRVLATA